MTEEKCDHNALAFMDNTWEIECFKCRKKWDNREIKRALLLLEEEATLGSVVHEVKRAMEWIQRDVAYIKRKLEKPTITITGGSCENTKDC